MRPAASPIRRGLLLGAAAALVHAPARAAAWPARAVRLVVAYPPGGVSDEIARALAAQLAPRLGVPVVVEHRAGAGGAVAMEWLARAAPDGHALCFSAITPLSLSPLLRPVGYDPRRDIAPVASVMLTPVLVVGTPAFEGESFAAMLAAARSRPGRIRWATSGTGTTGHLVLAQVCRESAADITHVPYKGGGQQINDALGGQFELLSTNVGPLQLQHVRDGRFRPLAVGAPRRLAVLPGVPTLAELGFAGANRVSVFGLFAPGATPPAVLQRVQAEVARALARPALRRRLLDANNLPADGGRQAFARVIEAESRMNRALLAAGLVR